MASAAICGNLLGKKFEGSEETTVARLFRSGKSKATGVYPLPPPPPNASTGAGFAKMLCKILMAKNLEVKILTTKDLGPLPRFLYAPPPP
jgi:hypothetical protein